MLPITATLFDTATRPYLFVRELRFGAVDASATRARREYRQECESYLQAYRIDQAYATAQRVRNTLHDQILPIADFVLLR